MPETLAAARLTNLQTAVLETVAYSDLFDFPLRPAEVRRNLPLATPQSIVDNAIEELERADLLTCLDPYVTLSGREQLAALRSRRRASSDELAVTAYRYGWLIARLPFVRMVAITGSLAFENADADDDIDYLIVTAPGRVWLTRAMTMLVVRLAALRGVTLCPNYLLSESVLSLADRDAYTARELLQMVPVTGHAVHARMLAANAWWRRHLPNAKPPTRPADAEKPSFLRRAVEWMMRSGPFDRLEAWLLARKGAELRNGAGPEATFDDTMCKGHLDAWRERTRRRLDERMKQLLEPPA